MRVSASSAKRLAAWPAFMSAPPRPYIQSPSITGSKGGCVHMSSGPAGTTSTWACRISERPVSARGRWMPTTIGASECASANCAPPGWRRDGVAIHREAVHGVAARAEGPEHEILDRVLGAAGRGEPHQRPGYARPGSANPSATEAAMRAAKAGSRAGSRVIGGLRARGGTRRAYSARPRRQGATGAPAGLARGSGAATPDVRDGLSAARVRCAGDDAPRSGRRASLTPSDGRAARSALRGARSPGP